MKNCGWNSSWESCYSQLASSKLFLGLRQHTLKVNKQKKNPDRLTGTETFANDMSGLKLKITTKYSKRGRKKNWW